MKFQQKRLKNLQIEINKQNMELLGIKVPDSILKQAKMVETKK